MVEQKGSIATIFLMAAHHVNVQVPFPGIVPSIEVGHFGQQRTRILRKGMEPDTVDADSKHLTNSSVRILSSLGPEARAHVGQQCNGHSRHIGEERHMSQQRDCLHDGN